MLALAEAGEACPISVRALADMQEVPYAFARAVQRDLNAAGLVEVTRGSTGGLCLSRPASAISLLDIVTATQDEPSVAVCASHPEWCSRSGACTVHHVWTEADTLLKGFLGRKTLAGLVSTCGK